MSRVFIVVGGVLGLLIFVGAFGAMGGAIGEASGGATSGAGLGGGGTTVTTVAIAATTEVSGEEAWEAVSTRTYEHPATRDSGADAWVGADALGRVVATTGISGPREGKVVGVFYFISNTENHAFRVYDVDKELAANPENPAYGPVPMPHWWGEPLWGYYTSNDPWVIRKQASMLADAGVDFICCDVTNAVTYDEAFGVLCRTYEEMREEGNRTPQIIFILHSKYKETLKKLYDNFYSKGLYNDLWFDWEGKPLVMCPPEGVEEPFKSFFTFRESWAWTGSGPHGHAWFGDGKDKWPWIDDYPQGYGWHDDPKKAEYVDVCVAGHPLGGIGRSFHDGAEPATEQATTETAVGLCFEEQWKRALEVDPEVVFVTGWNEWTAQRFKKDSVKGPKAFLNKPLEMGGSFFVDEYDEEFSRDIEPMRGGHEDDYYYQLVDYVRKFKGARGVKTGWGTVTAEAGVGGDFSQWDNVGPAYLDEIGDTKHRNHVGYGNTPAYVNDSGRNDLDTMKVAADGESVYFFVQTREKITSPEGKDWMNLLVATTGPSNGGGAGGGWNGFNYLVNRTRGDGGSCSVEVNGGDGKDPWTWNPAGSGRITWNGNQMEIVVPRKVLGLGDGGVRLAFKWMDHVGEAPGEVDVWDRGDVAPNGRLGYLFTGK